GREQERRAPVALALVKLGEAGRADGHGPRVETPHVHQVPGRYRAGHGPPPGRARSATKAASVATVGRESRSRSPPATSTPNRRWISRSRSVPVSESSPTGGPNSA